MKTVQIRDSDRSGCLEVSFEDVLRIVLPIWKGRSWRLLEMEAVSSGEINVAAIEAQLSDSPGGIEYSGPDLMTLALGLFQEINLVACVPVDDRRLPRFPMDEDYYRSVELSLMCHDSDLWEIVTSSEVAHARIRERFRDVEIHSGLPEH
ncbi:MAG: hypothetical protein AAF604_08835 [Acidobacteriota bacterium]